MTDYSLHIPKTIHLPAIRLPKLEIGKLISAFAGACEACRSANASAYGAAMGFGPAPKSTAKPEDDY